MRQRRWREEAELQSTERKGSEVEKEHFSCIFVLLWLPGRSYWKLSLHSLTPYPPPLLLIPTPIHPERPFPNPMVSLPLTLPLTLPYPYQ